MRAGRPHLAVAIVAALTIAGLLAMLVRGPTGPEPALETTTAPRLHDQPFRGAPLASPGSK